MTEDIQLIPVTMFEKEWVLSLCRECAAKYEEIAKMAVDFRMN